MKNRILILATAATMIAGLFSACGKTEKTGAEAAETDKRLSIVCTNFPEYDFARAITGDDADVTMLLKPGAESHSFEPNPKQIIEIQDSDLFVYVGGDSDEWVEDILGSMDQSKMHTFKLMDQVQTVEEELVEGMEPEDEEEDEAGEAVKASSGEEAVKSASAEDAESSDAAEDEEEGPEMDEHVWTSPKNAEAIVDSMADELGKLDPAHKESFRKNADAYIEEIDRVDGELKAVVDNAKRKEIIVADRFPFRYFCEEFGLTYYAAFPGCSTDTQPSAKTVAFLTDKVVKDEIPVVFHIELSNGQMAESISKDTGAKVCELNAVHNVSDQDFKDGATYVSLMRKNIDVLKEALQ
uniref:metal ABC transporter substrate-binding protein n=1 Tax=Eubacterium cellulosolvens TaxID=29322 RepID=UPI00047F443B|nr:metal ABC transporter substrate-binding protein [[Eubacterium] cellulosolvens]